MSEPDATADSPVCRSSSSADAESGRADQTFVTPPEHRRNRKSWSVEEQKAFWKRKKMEKKARQRVAAEERRAAQQHEWEQLSEAQKEERRAQAIRVHTLRRQEEAEAWRRCQENLANPRLPVLVFDLSFAWCMSLPDTKSTVSQIKFSYSALRRAGFPLRPVITSVNGKEANDVVHDATAQAAVLHSLHDFGGFHKLPPTLTDDQHWSDMYAPSSVVFLTADAEDVVTDIQPDTVYIIGAFVDHNQHKYLSRDTALRHGVRVARLPIEENMALANRCKVLTINHVVDVLVRFMCEGHDWASALETALPVRRVQQEALGSRKRRRNLLNGRAGRSDDGGSEATEEEEEEVRSCAAADDATES